MSKFATAIEAVVVLSGIAFVAVITAMMFGFFVPWLVAVMPHAVRPYLIWFENEPGALWLACGVAILIGAAMARAYKRARRQSPELTSASILGEATWEVFEPILLVTFILLKAFVWFGLLLASLPGWFGIDLPWLKANEREILELAVVTSLLLIPAIYAVQRLRWQDGEPRPEFSDSVWTVFWLLTSFGLLMLVIIVLAAAVQKFL